jgi:hypothetical protein
MNFLDLTQTQRHNFKQIKWLKRKNTESISVE